MLQPSTCFGFTMWIMWRKMVCDAMWNTLIGHTFFNYQLTCSKISSVWISRKRVVLEKLWTQTGHLSELHQVPFITHIFKTNLAWLNCCVVNETHKSHYYSKWTTVNMITFNDHKFTTLFAVIDTVTVGCDDYVVAYSFKWNLKQKWI